MMITREDTNNFAEISGIIDSEPIFLYTKGETRIYGFFLISKRLSETTDRIFVLASEDLLKDLHSGQEIGIRGKVSTYNKRTEDKARILVRVYAKEIKNYVEGENLVLLDGYMCKKSDLRHTPKGRKIVDMIIAVGNKKHSDYIPCIAWGKNADFAQNLKVGSHIALSGRFQSRTYQKQISESEKVNRVAYEVSVFKMEDIQGETDNT